MSAHTPGPWNVNPMVAQVDAFDGGAPLPVCKMLWPTDKRTEEETEANARLIAAAPTMLDALRAARGSLAAFKFMAGPLGKIGEYWEDSDEQTFLAVKSAIADAGGVK